MLHRFSFHCTIFFHQWWLADWSVENTVRFDSLSRWSLLKIFLILCLWRKHRPLVPVGMKGVVRAIRASTDFLCPMDWKGQHGRAQTSCARWNERGGTFSTGEHRPLVPDGLKGAARESWDTGVQPVMNKTKPRNWIESHTHTHTHSLSLTHTHTHTCRHTYMWTEDKQHQQDIDWKQ